MKVLTVCAKLHEQCNNMHNAIGQTKTVRPKNEPPTPMEGLFQLNKGFSNEQRIVNVDWSNEIHTIE